MRMAFLNLDLKEKSFIQIFLLKTIKFCLDQTHNRENITYYIISEV